MILYYALTTYHIECCLLHKISERKNEKAILMLSDIHQNSVAYLSRYKNSGIFDDVVILPEMDVNSKIKSLYAKHYSKRFILNIVCQKLHKVLPVNLSKFSEIYLCPDHFPFGWYIIKNKIRYHCFEEGCGVLSNNKFLLKNLQRNAAQHSFINYLGYFGNNKYAIDILADKQAQTKDYTNDKMKDFSVNKILSSLNTKELDKVFLFFGVDNVNYNSFDKLGIIVTQHFANLGIMSLEQQHYIYKQFADYFLNDCKIIIKPHPDDIAGRYKEIFNNSDILPFSMPSELLPYYLNKKVEVAIAANSTAVISMKSYCKRTICFDNNILTDYKFINHYYCVIKLLQTLLNNNNSVKTNANMLLLKELAITEKLSVNFQTENLFNDESLLVLSDKLLENNTIEEVSNKLKLCAKNKTVIFINELNKYMFFNGENKNIFSNLRPVFIIGNNNEQINFEEVIYVYSNDKNVLKNIEDFNCSKELKYTGITINMNSISKAESEKIKFLEGVLQATEKRLNEYIKYKKKIDEQKI